jgi:hypothetical protein
MWRPRLASIHRVCIIKELLRAQAQVQMTTKCVEELQAQFYELADKDDVEIKGEL